MFAEYTANCRAPSAHHPRNAQCGFRRGVRAMAGETSGQLPGNVRATAGQFSGASGKFHRMATLVSTQRSKNFREPVRVQSVTVN